MKHVLVLFLWMMVGCQTPKQEDAAQTGGPVGVAQEPEDVAASQPADSAASQSAGQPEEVYDLAPPGMGIATFAGGCFWCMEKPFESIDGVVAVISGYTAGPEENPTYKQVSSGSTGHTEAVRVIYDPNKVKYSLLLDVFWRNIDPTQANGQFVDKGAQYRTGIYFHDESQRQDAEASRAGLLSSGKFKTVVTEIEAATVFWPAEVYHQDFYKKSPGHYNRYRSGSGRDEYLEKTWGKEAGGYALHGASH